MGLRESKLHYVLFAFLSVLAVRSASSSSSAAQPTISPDAAAIVCQTHDQPNPIATTYPNNATGTLNGTIAVVPITLTLARQLIPAQYRILEKAYRALLPSFPADMYPAIVQSMHDHDVQASGFSIPDFSRAGIEFPFLDLLGDNSSSFKWSPSLLMTATNLLAIGGAVAYGTNTFPATFDPSCDAYRAVPNAAAGTTSFSAKSVISGQASASSVFSPTTLEMYPLAFYKNVTNQPMFADGKTCDNMVRLFNTSVTTAPNKIENVKGTVKVKLPPLTSEREWTNVYGIRLDTAFIENNYLPCENFRGYSGV
ncbi:hypothetical protein P153DRAFT_379885 [Dothidotthia symphoricarpi CBS 119687]|uniref:Uncharacterized protein n=1 Tax=Dothidotthia symphoricarpi CBS 119687 TaxID=1392245 RepID=A0A6A5ZYI5_9PLEO|nr:uncharacterized protein P153DRAFT_379885 [Dothidotthia symphoricarpi CBS 119687]KAF2123943.1 hypothetical protein P153DRAFT_379885 [Dothidotthia symphoricarpi CBS 119687]